MIRTVFVAAVIARFFRRCTARVLVVVAVPVDSTTVTITYCVVTDVIVGTVVLLTIQSCSYDDCFTTHVNKVVPSVVV